MVSSSAPKDAIVNSSGVDGVANRSSPTLEQIKEKWSRPDRDTTDLQQCFRDCEWDKMFSEIRELLDREITCKKCFVLDEWHEQAKELALKDKRIAELEGGEDSKLASLEAAHELGIRHAKKQAERIAALEKECASWKFKYGNLANKFAELKAENGTFEKWLLDNQTEEDHYSKERPRPVITKLLKANEVLNMFRKKRLERNEN